MNLRRLIIAFSVAGLAWMAAAGSAAPGLPAQQKLGVEITVLEKQIADPTPEGLSLVFVLNVKNLLTVAQRLSGYDYRAVIDGLEYLNMQTALETPIRIEGREEARIALPIKITYDYLYAAVPALKGRDQAACFVSGGMSFQDDRSKGKRVPVSFSGEFPIFRGVEINILPVEVRDLTVGGADLVFKAAVGNPNGFPFTIARLSFKIELVGIPVKEGVTGRGVAVDAHGEKAVAVPLLLDFFELGRPLYDGLSQPPVAVRLAGEVEMSSVWGTFKVAFDRSAKVAVAKIS
jgi:LEA14-like dessication related protein